MFNAVTIRLCPACQTGYIMSYDLHAACEGCLGEAHAGQAMSPQASCLACQRLPAKERKRRLLLFTPLGEDEFPVKQHVPLDEVLEFFDAGPEPIGSVSDAGTTSSTPVLPFFYNKEVKVHLWRAIQNHN